MFTLIHDVPRSIKPSYRSSGFSFKQFVVTIPTVASAFEFEV